MNIPSQEGAKDYRYAENAPEYHAPPDGLEYAGGDHSTLEAVPHSTLEPARYGRPTGAVAELSDKNAYDQVPRKPRIWRRRRECIIGTVLLVLVAIGIAVGCGVGLTLKRDGSSGDGPSSTANVPVSACNGTVCPQILAVASRGGNAGGMSVFARGTDKSIWHREISPAGDTWQGPWNVLPDSVESQPTALTLDLANGSYTAVFAVDSGGAVQINEHRSDSWAGWTSIRDERSLSPPAPCAIKADRIDAWYISPSLFETRHWYFDTTEGATVVETRATTSKSSSAAAILCRREDPVHELAIYSGGSLRHNQYRSSGDIWTNWTDCGHFVADPVIVGLSNDRTDIFGVGRDGAMYTVTWKSDTGYSSIMALNGSFESIPSILVSGIDRMDVVALGTDHLLKHRTWTSGAWLPEWENLEVFANSAPLVFTMQDSSNKRRISMAIVGLNGEMNYTSWEESNSASWKGLGTWTSAGGKLITTYMPEIPES